MKQLDPANQPSNDEIREERQEIKELRHLGEMAIPKGHTVYQYDMVTKTLKAAEYEHKTTIDISRGAITTDGPDGKPIGTAIKGKIRFDPNKIYFTALNWKNAVRKLNNELKAFAEDANQR